MVRIGLALGEYPGRSAFKAKRLCMGHALSQVDVGFAGEEVRFPTGKAPLVDGNCVLSLSHSGDWILCAAARSGQPDSGLLFGVDLERHRTRDFDRIGHVLGWPSQSESTIHFYRRWTLVESLYKAVGDGWRQPFELLDCVTGDSGRRFEIDSGGWRWEVWWPTLLLGVTTCVVNGVSR